MKLEIKNATKIFCDKVAINDFTMEMTEGVYGLLGPNGSGKTTLMRIIADVLKPTEGQVLLNGIDKNQLGEDYRDLVGYLPQDMGYYKNFTAERFLEYIAALKGINKKESKKKIDELLDVVSLKDSRKRKVGNFSGGMIRRLGIAQALLNNPKILILDEPTAGLDPEERIKFRNLISDISKDRIVILSTHIVSDIEFIAKEVILLKQGILLGCSSGNELLKELYGKVWIVSVDEVSAARFEKQYNVVNIRRKEKQVELRILSNSKPMDEAEEIEPNFEDMYVYYFNKKVRE